MRPAGQGKRRRVLSPLKCFTDENRLRHRLRRHRVRERCEDEDGRGGAEWRQESFILAVRARFGSSPALDAVLERKFRPNAPGLALCVVKDGKTVHLAGSGAAI